MFRARIFAAIIAFLTASSIATLSAESGEVKLGKDLVSRFEKNAKLLKDPGMVERVNRIGQAVATAAERLAVPASYGSSEIVDFDYTFKVIDDNDINAFSFPGGAIYVYKGLLDFVKSDDELAGVLAHEVAHASHHHVMALLRKQSKIDKYVALVAIVGGISKMRGKDLANVLYGAQFVRTARMTGYGREAEQDADKTGVSYAQEVGFDPAGIIAFLNRLTEYQEERGEVRNLGIFQTHPQTDERCIQLAEHLTTMGVEVDFRKAARLAEAKVEPADLNGKQVWCVVLEDRQVCTTVDADGISSRERAETTRAAINGLLHEGLSSGDIRTNAANSQLVAKDKVILKITPADSAAVGAPPAALLARAVDAIRYAIWTDWIKKGELHNAGGSYPPGPAESQ